MRSRSVSGYDPQVLVAGAVSRSGMAAMRAMRDGELPVPPVGRLVPGDLVLLERPGRTVATASTSILLSTVPS